MTTENGGWGIIRLSDYQADRCETTGMWKEGVLDRKKKRLRNSVEDDRRKW